ncbi:MAG: glycosyltransferase family 4 protein, partial [Saprospiraceae bacterium]
LHKLGYRVNVLANGDYAESAKVNAFDAAQPFPIKRFQRYGIFTQLLRIILALKNVRAIQPAITILSGRFSLWCAPLIRLMGKKTRLVAIIHGHEPIFGKPFLQRLTNYVIAQCDAIIPVSRFSRDNIPVPYRKGKVVRIIPNGIDKSYLSDWPMPEHIGHLPGSPALLTVGHLSPRKGQHRVIRALPALLEKLPDTRYHIVGRDVQQQVLLELAKQLGVSDKVFFYPPTVEHRDLSQFYGGADVFMLLSENQPNGDVEGFGIAALEANFFGLPVVGARYCGVEDAVALGKSGLLVDGDNIAEIVEAVATAAYNKPHWQHSARQWACVHDWAQIGKQYAVLFEEILSGKQCAE